MNDTLVHHTAVRQNFLLGSSIVNYFCNCAIRHIKQYPIPSDISVDAMDVSGGQQVDVDHDIKKIRLKRDGSAISVEKVDELGNGTAVLDPNRFIVYM